MSSLSSSQPSALYMTAPLGTLDQDVDVRDVDTRKTRVLSMSTKSHISLFDDKYVSKYWRVTEELPRELPVILLAGDCAVSVIGRTFHEGKVKGIVMPYETLLDPPAIASKNERIRIIHQLCDLVRRLHEKNIIHGDIKPTNLLLCSDGQLRFCDFGCESVEGDGFAPNEYTDRYASPWRVRNDNKPLSKAEDLYSTGVSIWEIYTGDYPFPEVPLDDAGSIEDFVRAGVRPDISRIDDPAIASLISSYLDAGPRLADAITHTGSVCIETGYCLRFCTSDPPHTYTCTLQCWSCIREKVSGPCPRKFVAPRVTDTTSSPICTTCNRGVINSGFLQWCETCLLACLPKSDIFILLARVWSMYALRSPASAEKKNYLAGVQ